MFKGYTGFGGVELSDFASTVVLVERACSLDYCSLPVKAKALCNAHYAQQYRTGKTWPVLPQGENNRKYATDAVCAVEGCERPHKCSGYCNTHYAHVLRYGEPIEIGSRVGKRGHKCREPKCQSLTPYTYCGDHQSLYGECEATGCQERASSPQTIYCARHRAQDRQIRFHHGISLRQREALVEAQGGRCAICRREVALHYDHDHTTGEHRGMLCPSCNMGLGNFFDNIETLERAAEYLRGRVPSSRAI